jgi:hypothetical protein
MVSKPSELAKRQARDRCGRFASTSSRTAPPLSCQEVGSSSRRHTIPPTLRMQEVGSSRSHCTAPPPLRQEEASSNDSVEMWVVRRTAPLPPLCLVTPPPPTCVDEVSSDDSPSDSSRYNDECPHAKEVSSYICTASIFQLFSRITKCVYIRFPIQKLEKIGGSQERTLGG